MFKKIKLILCLYLLVASFCASAQTKTIPYQQLVTSTGSTSGSSMFFGATMTTSSITVTFEGPSDRWIALGFGSAMPSTDALIYSNGTSSASHTLGWFDYYISSYNSSGVTLDATQNWNIVSNNVASSQRTVVATRTLSTGDANDAVINFTSTALNLVWAKGSSADYTIAYHGSSNRASGIQLTWLSQPSASFVTVSNTICAGSSMTYSNLSTGGLTSYTWNFGGATPATSTSTNPVVTYTAPGTYSVALTASNAIGTSTYTQVNYITVTNTVSPSLSINQISGSNPLCQGASASFTATPVNGGTAPSYQWKINGSNVGTNSPTFSSTTLSNNASLTCVMISNAVCPSPTNASSSAITMTVNSNAPASLSIALIAGNNPLCSGSAVSFTAIPVNGGTTPSYQWKINGSPVGTNSSNFTSNTLANGDLVNCELSSNAACASTTFAVSSSITMSVSSVLSPSVTISITNGVNPLCSGSLLTFTATSLNGGQNPSYQWQLNGIPVGSNSPVYSTNSLSNSQTLTCLMTSALSCSSPSFALSSALTLTVHPIPVTPSITPSGTIGICNGESLVLVSSASTGNLWSSTAVTQSINVNAIGTYFVTQTLNGCTSAPSSVVSVTAHPQPSVTIAQVNALCTNEPAISLQGLPSGGTYNGIGVTGNLFDPSLAQTGNNLISYIYTDNNNCTDSASTSIMVSECLSLNALEEIHAMIKIYPNPVTRLLNIRSANEKINAVIITDATGKLIQKNDSVNDLNLTIDLSAEVAGIYFVRVILNEGSKHFILSKTD